jgi:sensor histidine kinase YesM
MERLDRSLDLVFTRHRWVLHVIFWAVVLLWYVGFFSRQSNNQIQTVFFVGLVLPTTILTSCFVNYFLIPRFLLSERYGFFLLYFTYTLIGSIFLEMIISIASFYLVADLKTRNMSPASFDFFFMTTSLLAVVFLGMTIKLLLHWRSTKEENQRLMFEKIEKELKFLKGQLNPHFLFNTLNNLYYLTTQKSDLAPAAILQLSEILDYSLYSSKAPFVPIEKEWQQLQNYIALESLHYEDRLTVQTSLNGDVSGSHLSPMMLITLMENAFKHGAMKSKGKSWIKLKVDCTPGQIRIDLSNSYQPGENGKGGIGMDNLRKQLSLLYPGKHDLLINTANAEEFSLTLSLHASP